MGVHSGPNTKRKHFTCIVSFKNIEVTSLFMTSHQTVSILRTLAVFVLFGIISLVPGIVVSAINILLKERKKEICSQMDILKRGDVAYLSLWIPGSPNWQLPHKHPKDETN